MAASPGNDSEHKNDHIEDIVSDAMLKQRISFDGFMRMEILNHLTDEIPHDVIHLCSTFYVLNLKLLLMNKPNKGEALISLALNCTYKTKEYFIACIIFKLLIKSYPTESSLYACLFNPLLLWGVLDEAEESIKKAIELETDQKRLMKYHHKYGFFFRAQKKYELALNQFMKSDEVNGILNQAVCYNKLKDVEKANTHYIKAIEMAPLNADVYGSYATFLRDTVKDYVEAERHYLKALEIDGTKSKTNSSYGYLLYLMGKYDEAMEYIEKGMEFDVKDENQSMWIHFYYGLVNKTLGNNEIAGKQLMKEVEVVERKAHDVNLVVDRLMDLKASDPLNTDYYERFLKLITGKD